MLSPSGKTRSFHFSWAWCGLLVPQQWQLVSHQRFFSVPQDRATLFKCSPTATSWYSLKSDAIMSQGGSPPRVHCGGRQQELGPVEDPCEGRHAREHVGSLDFSEDTLMNTLARVSREAEGSGAAGGSSTSAGGPCGHSSSLSHAPADTGRTAQDSDGELAAAIEKYRSKGFLNQQSRGRRQQTGLCRPENAALLCSEVDLACLRDGLQAPADGLGSLQLEGLDSSASATGILMGSTSLGDGRSALGQLSEPHLAALQTAMADFAAADRAQRAADSSLYSGTAPGRRGSHLGGGSSRGAATQCEENDALNNSILTKLLSECQSSLCEAGDLGTVRQDRDSSVVKSELPETGAALSPELLALLQHHAARLLPDKAAGCKRLLASVSGSSCSSSINSRRTSSCSPGADEEGSEEARMYKRRALGMRMLEQRRNSLNANNRVNGSSELRALAASLTGAPDGDILEALELRNRDGKRKQEQGSSGDSPPNPMSPSYLAELQLIERVANGDPLFNEDGLGGSSLRGPLGYYSVCEATNKEESSPARLYPVVRGVSRDNTKKRWAVYWKGYRRYFYDKFFESCVEAYRRAVQFRQQATTAAAAVAATGNPAHLIAAGLHGSPGGPGNRRQQVKGETPETVAAVLASAAAAVAGQTFGDAGEMKAGAYGGASSVRDRCQDDRTIVCLYKEAILFVLEDLRNNVLSQYLTSRAAATVSATASTVPHAANVELAAATTAKRLLDQLLLVHTNLVGNATSTAELQPSLMIVAPCLEDLKLPSQQTPQQQLQLLQSILAMHIQQLLLVSRYLNKGDLPSHGEKDNSTQKLEPAAVKAEAGRSEASGEVQKEPQECLVATASSEGAVDVHA
ncbi:hypothetical protein Efla_000890 [Eimeria flavescens]